MRFLLVAMTFFAALFVDGTRQYALAGADSPVILYTVAPKFVPLAWLRGGERFPKGSQIWLREGEQSRTLVKGFTATADASVSFDGQRVLFAGKRTANQPWQIWEVLLSGNAITQVTSCKDDCVRPLYLPDNRLVYARKLKGRFSLESASLSGAERQQLSFVPGNFFPNDVLRDGRILFSSAYPLGSGREPELYLVYADGSGVESYRCDHTPRYSGKQLLSGDVVFTHGSSLAKFTSALAHEESVSVASGEFTGDVAESATGDWLISWRPHSDTRFALSWWSATSKQVVPVLTDAANNLVQPVLVAPRQVPDRHPSGLHEWQVANLLTLDVSISRSPLPSHNVTSVRGYTLDEAGREKGLGSAPVAADGSFFVQVPGNRPVRFELVDGTGNVVAQERGWFWASKGEQRACVGCHAGPERAPENAIPQILQSSTEPADFSGTPVTSRSGGRK